MFANFHGRILKALKIAKDNHHKSYYVLEETMKIAIMKIEFM
jgi:hypothetical protein